MTKRCCVVTVVILCAGTAASVGAYFVAEQISYALENHYFKEKAEQRVEVLTGDLQQRLSMVRDLGTQLTELSANTEEELHKSEKKFEALAASLKSDRRIATVEWAPHVRWQDRVQFEELIQSIFNRKQLRITQFAPNGQKTVLDPEKRQMLFPTLFALPSYRLAGALLLSRRVPQPNFPDPFVAVGRKFYPGKSRISHRVRVRSTC